MSDLPTFSDAKDAAVDAVAQHGRTLIPWLPDPPTCDCGALMYASESFDVRQAAYVASWECRACDGPDRYRDPEYGEEFADPPREGSPVVREYFDR
jgi:hypothetical protein